MEKYLKKEILSRLIFKGCHVEKGVFNIANTWNFIGRLISAEGKAEVGIWLLVRK
jgi:hypothetical protein